MQSIKYTCYKKKKILQWKKQGKKILLFAPILSGISHTPQYDFSFFALQYIQVVIVFVLTIDWV